MKVAMSVGGDTSPFEPRAEGPVAASAPLETVESAPRPTRSTRRIVLLTLGGVVLTAAVIGGGVLAYLAYDRQVQKAAAAEERATALRDQLEANAGLLATMKEEVDRQRQLAADEYLRGLKEGRESEQELNAEFGLTYADGYNDAFAGFGEWEIGGHYIVEIGKGEDGQKYEILTRSTMEPCTQYYVSRDDVWRRTGVGC